MIVLFFIIKVYIILLMFRYVATRQELTFNPIGRTVAMLTEPAFKKFKVAKEQSDRFIPMLILLGIMIAALINMLFTSSNPVEAVLVAVRDFLLFFMMFFIVSVLLGSMVNKPAMGYYVMFFFRLGAPWVKLTRTFIPITSGKIIYPTVLVIFLLYVCFNFIIMAGLQIFSGGIGALNPLYAVSFSLKNGLIGLTGLLNYLCWLIVARALMSWVSPDIRNPAVQVVYMLTEPVLLPFRRIIPSVGIFDFSAFVAILVISVGSSVLQRLIVSFL